MKNPLSLTRISPAILPIILSILFSTVILISTPKTSLAYDNDTHFWLTYYLAIKAGFTDIQATQIASANISIDFDKQTQPGSHTPDSKGGYFRLIKRMQIVHRKYHAFPSKFVTYKKSRKKYIDRWSPKIETDEAVQAIANQLIENRKDTFWKRALRLKMNPGPFLHYLQDSISHRRFTHVMGHMGYDRVDFLSRDRAKAQRMGIQTLKYLLAYKRALSNPIINNNLKDSKTLENEITIDDDTRREIENLIDELIRVNPIQETPDREFGHFGNKLLAMWSDAYANGKPSRIRRWRLRKKMLDELMRLSDEGFSPNSFKAKMVVLNALGRPGSKLPYIWLYDYGLSKHGDLIKAKPLCLARKYIDETKHPSNDDYTYKLESFILGRAERVPNASNETKFECLPFKLLADNIASIPLRP